MSEGAGDKRFWFDDHVVGAEMTCASHAVSADEIKEFAGRWDPQPWHVDEEAAASSVFGGLTACSAHIFSIYCWLVMQ